MAKTDATAATTATTGGAFTETFGIASNRGHFLLLFHQDLIESTDGFVEFFTKPGRTFFRALSGKFADTTSAAGTSYRAFGATGAAGTAAGSFTATIGTAASTARRLLFCICGRCCTATTEAFASLAHTAYATGQRARIATITAGFTVTIAITVSATLIATAARYLSTAAG